MEALNRKKLSGRNKPGFLRFDNHSGLDQQTA
jgi:hypothetical protein